MYKYCQNYYHYTLQDLLELVFSDSDIGSMEFGKLVENAVKDLTSEYGLTSDTVIHSPEVNTLFCQYLVPLHISDTIRTSQEEISPLTVIAFRRFMRYFIEKIRETYDRYSILISNYKSSEANLLNAIKSRAVSNTSGSSNSENTINTSSDSETSGTTAGTSDTSNIGRFNDTPQNGGLYTDDTYSTNINEGRNHTSNSGSNSNNSKVKNKSDTQNTTSNVGTAETVTENDGATVMARLDELRRLWRGVYMEWANEFIDLFIGG